MTPTLLLAGLLGLTPSPAGAAQAGGPATTTPAPGPAVAAAPEEDGHDDGWLEAALAPWPVTPPRSVAPPSREAPRAAWLRRAAALAADALPSARPLRRPLPARPAAEGTLDAVVGEEKGAAVLAMAEAYVGAARWDGVLEAARAGRAAAAPSAAPLLSALRAVAGEEVAAALRGFLEQPGAPLLRVEVRCGKGGARAIVRQERLAPGPAAGPGWTVPACLRAGGSRGEATVCALIPGPRAEVALPLCPAWLWANAGGAGYHVIALAPREVPLLWPHLTTEERLALAVDATLLARRGALPAEDALALVGPLARDPDARAVAAALRVAGLVEPRWLGPADHARWRAFLRRTFGARARALGWLPRPDDDEAARALRSALLPLLAGEGEDAVLAGEALALASRWLADRRQVPAEVAWPALEAAAAHGDQPLFDRVVAEAGQEAPAERRRLLAVLGRFRAPGPAAAALALAADPQTAPGDAAAVLAEALSGRSTRQRALPALRAAWDALAPRLSQDEVARLVEAAARPACEPAARAQVAAFLAPRVAPLDGAARTLGLALEAADGCLAARARGAPAVARFLARR